MIVSVRHVLCDVASLSVQVLMGMHIAGDLSSCFNAGLCAGAFIWGVLIDVIGRKWAFNISLFVTSFFGLLVGMLSQPVYVHFD